MITRNKLNEITNKKLEFVLIINLDHIAILQLGGSFFFNKIFVSDVQIHIFLISGFQIGLSER